ncbi:rho GTPase-activating protein 20-like isoform X4 [Canis lupus dingo]|uniref:rho GTPase-activating protein 20-like isoform X4 n=1 Tax=Canis lupus dingo TaxID=286419 RepID=UPI0020C1C90B|nr:rho GTPase-activating protein 20-like isoform X4 [Canis lupus dingo]
MIVTERGREAETQAEEEAGSMHQEPNVGFDPGSPGLHPGPKAGATPLHHPGIPMKSSSVEVDTDSESTTSSEGATRTLLIHGPVELKRGWRRQKQQLFLYSDLLLMSNTKYKKNFKIKKKIPLNTMWIANCMDTVGDASNHSGRSFVLGWPMVNFVATFSSSEQKEKWRSYLQRYIMLAKEKEQPKSIHLKIFTDDKNSACGSEKDYQLWASSGKEEVPLIGHEHPYGIKMSHIPSTKPLSKEPEDSISPSTTQESLLLEQKIIEMQIQFMLKPRHPAQNKQGRGQKTTKSSAFRNLAFWRHAGTCQNNLCSAAPSAKPRQLFGVSLTHICDNDNLPVPILDFLRNTQGGIFSFDLYDKWLGVINEGTKEEKINAAQSHRERERGRDTGRGRSRLHALGARRGIRSRVSRIVPRAKGRRQTAAPPRDP